MEIEGFSFIIPNYNNGKLIGRCIDSILNQNFKNFEIIVIDDKSTDDSLKILDKYKNIILIKNKKNKGVSYSRNVGILKSTKKYIVFLDSDDYLKENYKKTILEQLENKIDLYIYDEIELKRNNRKVYSCNIEGIKTVKEILEKYPKEYLKAPVSYWIHNKIFIRSIIVKNNIKFNINKKAAEDQEFCYNYFSHIKNIKFINKELYYYNQIDVDKYKYVKYYHQTIKSIYKNNKEIFRKYNLDNKEVHSDIIQLFEKSISRIDKSNISIIKKLKYKFLIYIKNLNITLRGKQ